MGVAIGSDAPEWSVEQWLNHEGELALADLRGRVVAVEAFQMLCPGCVSHGLPQAQRVREEFGEDDVVVVGLHSVFEHHDAMRPRALAAFLHEYRVRFPRGRRSREAGRHAGDDELVRIARHAEPLARRSRGPAFGRTTSAPSRT